MPRAGMLKEVDTSEESNSEIPKFKIPEPETPNSTLNPT